MRNTRTRGRPLGASLLGVVMTLVVVGSVLAASSANFAINWSQTGAGGGEGRSSASYRLSSFTVGQAVAGNASSANFRAAMGYQQVNAANGAGATQTAVAGATQTAVAGATQTAVAGATQTAVAGATQTAAVGATGTAVAATQTAVAGANPATQTAVAATATAASGTAVAQTATSVAQTATAAVPTNTPGGSPTATATQCSITFTDVSTTNIFYGDITYLACRGIVNGTGGGNFSPNANTSRGQFAKIAALGFGIAPFTPASGQSFSDVPPGYIFYTFIETAFHATVVNGLTTTQCNNLGVMPPCYGPNVNITRAQVAAIVQRARNYTVVTPAGGAQTFTDVPTSNFAFNAVETLASRNIINGAACAGGGGLCFRPNDNIKRGELSKVVRRAIESLPLATANEAPSSARERGLLLLPLKSLAHHRLLNRRCHRRKVAFACITLTVDKEGGGAIHPSAQSCPEAILDRLGVAAISQGCIKRCQVETKLTCIAVEVSPLQVLLVLVQLVEQRPERTLRRSRLACFSS